MTKYNIPLPRLLGGGGDELRRLNVIDASVNLNIMPLSTATLTLPENESVAMRSWVEMFTSQGSAGVFRVRAPGRSYGGGNNTYQLDHGIVEVGDYIIKEEASETKYKGAANTVIRNIWGHYNGSKWQLGTVAPTEKVEYSGDYGNVLSALIDVMGQLPDYMMTFSFSTTPWTVNIVARPGTLGGEGRLLRNVKTARVTYDDSNMCTKLYCYLTQPSGSATAPSFVLDADTQSLYGIVEQTAGQQDEEETSDEFRAKCQKYLNQHKHPLTAISIEGIDLQAATGESVDGYSIGNLYRLALPKHNLTIEETLVTLNWPSVYGDPSNVNVTLGNAELSISGAYGGSGGGSASSASKISKSKSSAKAAHDDHIKRVEMGAILHEAGLEWDENHVFIFAHDEATGLGKMSAEINVNTQAITAEVTRASEAEGTLGSRITETAEEIKAEVYAANSTVYSYIQQTASSITAKVEDTEAGLITYVNQTASGIFTRMESGTNRTKISDTDPTLDPNYTPKVGDIWIESVHDGTWDGADGYDWDREEPYDWSQLMGARVKVWRGDHYDVVTDRQQMVSYRDVVDTAQVYLDRRISEIVNDEGLLDVYMAKLERTATDLRSEISHATSDFYSEIHQSSSNVTVWVANRPTSIIQDGIKSGKPTTMTIGNLTRAPIAGDLWIDSANQDTWDKALNGDHKWDDDAPYSWNELRSDKLYKYDGTDWAEIMDGSQLLYEDTYTEQDERHRAEIARKIEKVDGEWRDNYSRIEQRADMIYSTVQDRTANLSSRIEQTADRVSSAVGDITRIDGKISEVEGSAIWQRRDSITQVVGKFSVDSNGNIVLQSGASFKITKDGVQSDVVAQTQVDVINGTLTTHNTRITQNANEIATKASSTTVNAIDKTVSNHTTQIKQNADAIALRAKQTDLNAATGRISTVESTLRVQADQISSKVSKDGVISSINQTSESVTINAAKINLSGYVTASQMETAFATARSIKYLVASGTTITNSGGIYSKNIYLTSSLGDIELGNAVGSIGPASVDGGKITIPWTTLRGASGTAVTFNMADTAWYKGQVSAIKNAVTLSSPGWVDGKNVVSNSANSKTYTVNLPAFQTGGGTSWSNHKTTVTFSTQSVQTPLKSVEVDATSEYNSGYSVGYNAGWNACIANATAESVLTDWNTYNNANSTNLYYNDGSAWKIATGSSRIWRYGGLVRTRYILPNPK